MRRNPQHSGTQHGAYGERDWQRGSTPPHYGETPQPPARPSHRGRGPKDYTRADDRIRDEVCELLTDEETLDATGIEVRVETGEVILSGTVTSREDKRAAEQIAESVRGVTDIHNQLRIA